MGSPVPRSAMFTFAVRIPPAKKTAPDGTLVGWTERHKLPRQDFEGTEPFADVWAGWSPEGLHLAVRVEKNRAPRVIPRRLDEGDCVEFYVDTRDVRTAHRAGRFCHKFVVAPVGGAGRGRKPVFHHLEIHRSTATPTIIAPEDVQIASSVEDDRYTVELFLPAAALTGYDVEVNRRLGLAFIVHDTEHGIQNWPHPTVLPQGWIRICGRSRSLWTNRTAESAGLVPGERNSEIALGGSARRGT